MDVAAMPEAVGRDAADPALRAATGAIGMDQVAARHAIDIAGPRLLRHLRDVARLAPEVSVVLPNDKDAPYLDQRLASIAAQELQDIEFILLDDASTDGSASILEAFAEGRADTRLVANAENSGSPFVQWMRGMEMARSDVIWLAGADGSCEPDLLATLAPLFDDRNMRLASCMSVPVRADGSTIGDYRALYLDRIAPGRYDRDVVAPTTKTPMPAWASPTRSSMPAASCFAASRRNSTSSARSRRCGSAATGSPTPAPYGAASSASRPRCSTIIAAMERP
jgi:hypothetical protein